MLMKKAMGAATAFGSWSHSSLEFGVRGYAAHLDGRLGVPLCAAGGGGHSVCHALLRSGVTKIGRSGWSVHILRVYGYMRPEALLLCIVMLW